MRKNNKRRTDKIEVIANQTNLFSYTGLIPFFTFCERSGFFRLFDARFPEPGTDGYPPSDIIKTLWTAIIISEGRFHLSIIDMFRETPAFLYALKMCDIPSASAVGDFIKRMARAKIPKRNRKSKKEELVNGIDIIQNIFYEVTKEIMKQMRSVLNGIIDYDASVIEENKQYSKKMYTGEYGTMGYFAFMGRICIMPELEPGNHSPGDKADRRTISCIEFCWKTGIKVKKMRADAASYIANLFNFCNKKKYKKIEFYIRAVSSNALKQSIETVGRYFEAGWKKERIRQAKKIEGKEIIIGEATHCMDKTDDPFRLICEKKDTRLRRTGLLE